MTRWTSEGARAELDSLIEEVEGLKSVRRFSADHTRWMARTLRFLEEVFGPSSRYYLTIASITWGKEGAFLVHGFDPMASADAVHQEAYLQKLDSAKGFLQAARDELETSSLADVYHGKDSGPESSLLIRIINLVERKLRKAIREEPSEERAIQEALENLLIGADIEYRRESDRVRYASKNYVPDFTFPKLDLALELKLCARSGREKELIAEINDDILGYGSKFGNQLFVIYDVGQIRDVDDFAGSLEESEGVIVRVVKH